MSCQRVGEGSSLGVLLFLAAGDHPTCLIWRPSADKRRCPCPLPLPWRLAKSIDDLFGPGNLALDSPRTDNCVFAFARLHWRRMRLYRGDEKSHRQTCVSGGRGGLSPLDGACALLTSTKQNVKRSIFVGFGKPDTTFCGFDRQISHKHQQRKCPETWDESGTEPLGGSRRILTCLSSYLKTNMFERDMEAQNTYSLP